ncbi:hypothetical protein [Paraburkholderia sp. MM5482-R1]|uniref:hypothetical protein n=1 Tax=Paraburkholderia sp. MM5482-R1 TaxID=2991063 RepID=UPI003D1BEB48
MSILSETHCIDSFVACQRRDAGSRHGLRSTGMFGTNPAILHAATILSYDLSNGEPAGAAIAESQDRGAARLHRDIESTKQPFAHVSMIHRLPGGLDGNVWATRQTNGAWR